MRRALAILTTVALLPVAVPAAHAALTCYGRVATIVGTEGRDNLVGTAGNDVIVGRDGVDSISGKGGDDLICGGTGGSSRGDSTEQLSGGGGHDVLVGGAGPDLLLGGSGRDTLLGGSAPDILQGGGGDDRLDAGGGPDHLWGNDGNDRLNGGIHPDIMGMDAGSDLIDGGLASDRGDTLIYTSAPRSLYVHLGRGVARGWGKDRLVDVENVADWGGDGGDGDPTYPDTLIGDDRSNQLHAGGAEDSVMGRGGDDCLGASEADDRLDGGPGFDTVTTFYCFIQHGPSSALPGREDGGLFIDLEAGIARNEFTGTDSLVAIEGAFGTVNQDEMWGDGGNNYFFGDEGNDTLHGRAGDDQLDGSAATDTADGGGGTDVCRDVEAAISCE